MAMFQDDSPTHSAEAAAAAAAAEDVSCAG